MSAKPMGGRASLALVLLLATASCAHGVRIITIPAGAEVSIDGKKIGKGPVLYRERSGTLGRSYALKAELPGFQAVTKMESVRICPTPANLILDSLGAGFLFGWCLRDEYILDLTQTGSASPPKS